ncbi:MAG: DUF721 domain-containing protein [Dysgonamonadaceae bacterium]|jgi:hypothetical protein|nr:DUF721 domain-containing protein [Dysgonamonadaceae bacterium]
MKRVNTQNIGSIIDEILAGNPELSIKMAENRAINAWYSLMGNTVTRYTDGLYIRNRILYAKITSSVVKSELTLCREQLIRRLNEKAGREVLDNIVFK